MAGNKNDERVQDDKIEPAATIVIAVVSEETGCSAAVVPSKDAGGTKVNGGIRAVDLEIGGGEWDTMCRICHLSSELVGSIEKDWELIDIGCGCKGELGIAHQRCAEAWFRVKGNRFCEICGLNAKNIVGEEDMSFMDVWHEGRRRRRGSLARNSRAQRGTAYWTSQRFCSFLISFIVIAFILQWYFRESFA